MFLILPVGMDYQARRYPVVTFTIMGICTAVYLVTLFLKLGGNAESVWQWESENLWLIPSESHWWTYLTSMFVHGGFFYLFGNMVYLFLFGACVEDLIGRLRFIIFYLLCGVGSALAYIMFTPEHFASEIPEGGASGAISACIGGYLLLRGKAKIEFKWILIMFFRVWNGEFQLPAWLVISFWFLEDLASMLLAAADHHHGGGVAFGAHVGGTLLGMGLIALKKILPKSAAESVEDEEEEPTPVMPAARQAFQAQARAPAQRTPIAIKLPAILLFYNGAQSGPFTMFQIQEKFANDEIPADAFYWQEGMTDWRPADELR